MYVYIYICIMYMYTHMLHGHLGAYLEFHHEHMANHVVARLRLTHPYALCQGAVGKDRRRRTRSCSFDWGLGIQRIQTPNHQFKHWLLGWKFRTKPKTPRVSHIRHVNICKHEKREKGSRSPRWTILSKQSKVPCCLGDVDIWPTAGHLFQLEICGLLEMFMLKFPLTRCVPSGANDLCNDGWNMEKKWNGQVFLKATNSHIPQNNTTIKHDYNIGNIIKR